MGHLKSKWRLKFSFLAGSLQHVGQNKFWKGVCSFKYWHGISKIVSQKCAQCTFEIILCTPPSLQLLHLHYCCLILPFISGIHANQTSRSCTWFITHLDTASINTCDMTSAHVLNKIQGLVWQYKCFSVCTFAISDQLLYAPFSCLYSCHASLMHHSMDESCLVFMLKSVFWNS